MSVAPNILQPLRSPSVYIDIPPVTVEQQRIQSVFGHPLTAETAQVIAETVQEELSRMIPIQASGEIKIRQPALGAAQVEITEHPNMTPQQAALQPPPAPEATGVFTHSSLQDSLAGGIQYNDLEAGQMSIGPGQITRVHQNFRHDGTTEYIYDWQTVGVAATEYYGNIGISTLGTGTTYNVINQAYSTPVTYTTPSISFTTPPITATFDTKTSYTLGQWITGYVDGTTGQINWVHHSSEQIKKEQLRQKIKNQLTIITKGRKAYLPSGLTEQEAKARDTLRDMITESEWRRYVTNSFLMVRGESGRWYQIFSNHHNRIKVYEKNKHIANLCIHTDAECPPTDHVISMKVLIELDEEQIWKDSNAYWIGEPKRNVANGYVVAEQALTQIQNQANQAFGIPEGMLTSGYLTGAAQMAVG